MNKKLLLILFFINSFNLNNTYSQNSKDKKGNQYKNIEDLWQRIDDYKKMMIQDLDDLSSSELEKKFNKKFNDVVEKFNNDSFQGFFDDNNFDDFFNNWGSFKNKSSTEYEWMENTKEHFGVVLERT